MQTCEQYCEAMREGGPSIPREGRRAPESEASRPDPVVTAHAELLGRVIEAIRTCVVSPSTEEQLDDSIDNLLDEDWFFVAMRELPKGPIQRAHLRALARYAGDGCAAEVQFLLLETAKAFAALEEACLRMALEKDEPEIVAPEALFLPSAYLGCPALPAEVQRAFLGRDIAQIALIGMLAAPEWEVPLPRVLELCARFKRQQPFWIEFICAGATSIDPLALPKDRTDFREAFARNQRANEAIEAAGKHLDSTGGTVYFLSRRSHEDGGIRTG